jgi:hypothetical protein
MFVPPTTLSGVCAIRARHGTEPRAGSTGAFPLRDGRVARASFLEWELDSFDIEDVELASAVRGGRIVSIAVWLPDEELHLVQGASAFWCSAPDAELDRDTSVPSRFESGAEPKWYCRSQQQWPRQKGEPIPFLGQGVLGAMDVYLFRAPNGLALAHVANRSEQDVEAHYASE